MGGSSLLPGRDAASNWKLAQDVTTTTLTTRSLKLINPPGGSVRMAGGGEGKEVGGERVSE